MLKKLKLNGEANDKLDGALDSAKDLNENDYSVEDWNTILAAIEKAENVSGTPADVMVGATELESIISNTTKLDRSELNAALILAQSKNQSDYTPESWAMLTAALEAANNTKNTSRVQAEIDTKAEALTLALNSLQSATPDNSENDNNNNNSNSGSGNNNSDNTPPKDNTSETDKSVETDKTTETEKSADTDEAKKNGCGSAVTVTAIALVAILTLGTGITFKKKED